MYVGAGLSLLGMLCALATRGPLRDQLIEEDPDLTAGELDRADNLGQTTGFGEVVNITSIVLAGAILWLLSDATGQYVPPLLIVL
jgi:hypothetical protein